MKKSLLILSFFLASSLAFADVKIGVVDLEFALSETQEGAKAKTDLKKEQEDMQADLTKKETGIRSMQSKLQNQMAAMSSEKKQAEEMKIQEKAAELQQLYMSMQQKMMSRQREVMDSLIYKITILSNKLAKEGKFDIILNKSQATVLYAKPEMDLTNQIIAKYNEAYPVKTSNKK